jgi:hypothetical protein
MSNTHNDDLLEAVDTEISNGWIHVAPDSAEFFSKLGAKFPTLDSRIDWSKIPNAVTEYSENVEQQLNDFTSFFNKVVDDYGLQGSVIYAGDGATDSAFILSTNLFKTHIKAFLSIPQHHYVVAENFAWVMVFTFEGDMGFGFAPAR